MRFFLFISVVQLILFLGHWFLYKTLVSFFGVTDPAKFWVLRVAMGMLSISFIGSSFLSFRYSNLPVPTLYIASVSWLGIFYLLFLASLLAWTIYGLTALIHLSLDRRVLITGLFGIALMGSIYGFINAGIIRINPVSLPLPNLPTAWEGKTAVWISDVHLGQVRNHRFAQRVTDMVQNLRPDIVFIGGDLYDGGEAMDLHHMVEPLSRLSPPLGTYFITGNHEEFYDNTPYIDAVRRAGIRALNYEKMEIDGLQIIGVGYRESKNQKQFRAILQKMEIDRQKPSLLLKHVPSDLEIARDQGISAQISGHAHHGQVFLFRFITSKVYKGYDYGLKKLDDLVVYTSSGVGTWGPPMRIDTIPEIVVIKFVRKNG
jgi:predicted MPP superfamily phosphohydrolase